MATTEIERRPYLPLTTLAITVAVVGFWRSYFGPFISGTVEATAIVHVHVAVFMGWLILFIVQVFFAATGRVALHVKLGTVGMWYGAVVVFVGLATGFNKWALSVESTKLAAAQIWLYITVADISCFAAFLGAAWIYRRKPEIHKRWMVVATTALLTPAVARMSFLGAPPAIPVHLLVFLSPTLLAMGYDFLTRRLVHPIYLVGIVVLSLVRLSKVVVPQLDTWAEISKGLATVIL